MGFKHACESQVTTTAAAAPVASRGILDEMCARRELPYKRSGGGGASSSMVLMSDEQEDKFWLPSSSSPMLSSNSGDPSRGGLPSSEPDPFGSTTITIPLPRSRGQGFGGRQNDGKVYRRMSPPTARSGAGGRTQRRRSAVVRPSRSPDIFDRMSSDPPSGGLDELCADDEEHAPRLIDGGGLSDTDQEEDGHNGEQPRQRASSKSLASSSGMSGEYGMSSASTMILATPVKTEYDPLTGQGFVTSSTSVETGGRKLRFVPSSATSSGNGRKRKLELKEDDDKENTQSRALGSITTMASNSRPVLGRVASLDFYAGSPAKRSSSLGAEARRLSEVVSKYAKTATPPASTMLMTARNSSSARNSKKSARSGGSSSVDRDRRHALGALEGHRKLNGSSSISSKPFSKASRLSARQHEKTTVGVPKSFSTGQLVLSAEEGKERATESLTGGRTDDEECARLLLGLGSSR
ncbi:hypothetical protein QFC19_007342 [Naganishia cerealis]|uniref:Uncharacterized protein n=1 Tax=Naganishia cerealis TaxID=610337 RepID=A0ACC2VBX2_9TREE|nr:hypothetical protein QFC19_007342 [Naganishia cerealis]